MMRAWMCAAAIAGCAASDATPKQDVAVELAAVTLGEDCPGTPPPPPPATKPAADSDAKANRLDDYATRACRQTSMQLSLKNPAAAITTIAIKRVELLDSNHKLLEVLAARKPTRWDGKRYVVWDQSIGANEALATSYVLASPSWDKLVKGRNNAPTTFHVRVTLTIGTQTRTIEKQTTAAAMIEPEVDT